MALILAVASPSIDLKAVTTVAGNTTLEHTTKNALRVLELLQVGDVPVARGAQAPLARPLETAQVMHGEDGLAGTDPFAPLVDGAHSTLVYLSATELIQKVTADTNGQVTLVATGPLTNVATYLNSNDPNIRKLDRIVLMGGAIGLGNWTPAAEFNIWVDPEAARIVFESGIPLTMIGLEVTHEAIVTPSDIEVWRELGAIGEFVAAMMDHFVGFHISEFGWPGAPLHDAVTIAHLIDPSLVRTQDMNVQIEVDSPLCRGRTVADELGVTGVASNAEVGLEIDRDRFVTLVTEHLSLLA